MARLRPKRLTLSCGLAVVAIASLIAVGGLLASGASATTSGVRQLVAGLSGAPLRDVTASSGVLLGFSRVAELSEVPPGLRRVLMGERDPSEVRIERRYLVTFEVERDLVDGSEHERFVDPLGRQIFDLIKPPEREEDEIAEEQDDLPVVVQATISRVAEGRPISRLQRELEFGHPVHAAKWAGPAGLQEVKVLDDGGVLFVELPATEPVPDEVQALAGGAQVEAIILPVWALIGADGEEQFLATGDRIDSLLEDKTPAP